MVPSDRIELSTSALPRMRSTTELRRRRKDPRYSGPRARGEALIHLTCDGTTATPMPVKPKQNEPCRPPASSQDQAAAAREARLAKALRDNLRRRKATARGPEDDSSDH